MHLSAVLSDLHGGLDLRSSEPFRHDAENLRRKRTLGKFRRELHLPIRTDHLSFNPELSERVHPFERNLHDGVHASSAYTL